MDQAAVPRVERDPRPTRRRRAPRRPLPRPGPALSVIAVAITLLVGPPVSGGATAAWVDRVGGRDATPVDVVDAMHAAWNAGDWQGWTGFLGDDPDGLLLHDVPTRRQHDAALMAAGSRMRRTGPCTLAAATADATVPVVCPTEVVDAFLDAPVATTTDVLVRLDGHPWIRVHRRMVERDLALRARAARFHGWLEDTHPDVAAAMGETTVVLALPNRDAMPTALELLPAFDARRR